MNKTPFVLLDTFHLKPGCAEEFLAFIHRTNDAMRHETTFVNTVVPWMTRFSSCCTRLGWTRRIFLRSRLGQQVRQPRLVLGAVGALHHAK